MARSIIRRFLSILSAKIGIFLLNLIITPLIVRILGPTQYGDYAFVMSLLAMTMILVNGGIFEGVRKYIAEDKTNKDWTSDIVGFYIIIAIAFAIPGSLLMFFISNLDITVKYFGDNARTYFIFISIMIIFRQLFKLFRGILMGFSLEHRIEPLRVAKRTIFAAVGLTAAYVGFELEGILFGHLVSSLIVVIIAGFLVYSVTEKINLVSLFNNRSNRSLLTFNIYSLVIIVSISSMYHIDILLLRIFEGSETTGFYNVALVVVMILWFVPKALQTVFLHSMSELWAGNKINQISRITSRTVKIVLLSSILLCLGMISLAEPFFNLYFGAEYLTSIKPFLLLIPGVISFAISRPLIAIIQSKGELYQLVLGIVIVALSNFILNLILIHQFGMNGAAVATSLSYLILLIFTFYLAGEFKLEPLASIQPNKIFYLVCIFAPLIILISNVINSRLASLVIVPPLGLIIYLFLLIKFELMTFDEMLSLYKTIKG